MPSANSVWTEFGPPSPTGFGQAQHLCHARAIACAYRTTISARDGLRIEVHCAIA